MKKYTPEEQRIYQIIMLDVRACWRVLIEFIKDRNNAKSYDDWHHKDYRVDIEFITITTLYQTLRSCFGIDTHEMQERLKNYRDYGRCVR